MKLFSYLSHPYYKALHSSYKMLFTYVHIILFLLESILDYDTHTVKSVISSELLFTKRLIHTYHIGLTIIITV